MYEQFQPRFGLARVRVGIVCKFLEGLELMAWARRFVVRNGFPWVASRSRTPAMTLCNMSRVLT